MMLYYYYLFAVLLGYSTALLAESPSLNTKRSEFTKALHLGTLDINSSTKDLEAKKHIELGMKLLHAFMYEPAQVEFVSAQTINRHAAMAYYGELMSQKHMLWQYENLSKAHAIIKKSKYWLDESQILPIEKALLHSAYRLFEPKKSSHYRLSQAILSLSDDKKKLNYDVELELALLLLKLGYVSEFPNDRHNVELLAKSRVEIDALFRQNPAHPGAIHYHLHYFDSDDQAIAIKAKPSAIAASTLLYSSSHLAHMSAHIYRRLRLWKAFVVANQLSINASDNLCAHSVVLMGENRRKKLLKCDAENRYHALEWLHFGALKLEDNTLGQAALARMLRDAKQLGCDDFYAWFYRMWARQFLLYPRFYTPIIKVRPITQKNQNTYWMAYSECGALLANGLLKIHQKLPITKDLLRLKRVATKASQLTDPFVFNTCKLNNALLLAYQFKQSNTHKVKNSFLVKAFDFEKKLISTEATPSLNFIDVNTFKLKFLF